MESSDSLKLIRKKNSVLFHYLKWSSWNEINNLYTNNMKNQKHIVAVINVTTTCTFFVRWYIRNNPTWPITTITVTIITTVSGKMLVLEVKILCVESATSCLKTQGMCNIANIRRNLHIDADWWNVDTRCAWAAVWLVFFILFCIWINYFIEEGGIKCSMCNVVTRTTTKDNLIPNYLLRKALESASSQPSHQCGE